MEPSVPAALATQPSCVPVSSGAVSKSRTDLLRGSLARDPTSQSFTIVNLPNRVGIVLGLQRVFRVCLILSAVLAMKRSNQALERTAARRIFTFQMIKKVSVKVALALGGGRSAFSRYASSHEHQQA